MTFKWTSTAQPNWRFLHLKKMYWCAYCLATFPPAAPCTKTRPAVLSLLSNLKRGVNWFRFIGSQLITGDTVEARSVWGLFDRRLVWQCVKRFLASTTARYCINTAIWPHYSHSCPPLVMLIPKRFADIDTNTSLLPIMICKLHHVTHDLLNLFAYWFAQVIQNAL